MVRCRREKEQLDAGQESSIRTVGFAGTPVKIKMMHTMVISITMIITMIIISIIRITMIIISIISITMIISPVLKSSKLEFDNYQSIFV